MSSVNYFGLIALMIKSFKEQQQQIQQLQPQIDELKNLIGNPNK